MLLKYVKGIGQFTMNLEEIKQRQEELKKVINPWVWFFLLPNVKYRHIFSAYRDKEDLLYMVSKNES